MAQEPNIPAEHLYGTWRLVRATAVDADGRPGPLPYGPAPMGRVVLNRDGRMMAVLCDGRPTVPAGEVRAYASYCGNFRIEDGRLVTTVDAADTPDRLGTEQVREMAFRNGRLVLRPPRREDGTQRELEWERDGPA